MSLGNAIYYPYIHLTNKNWLKQALLFWDKVSRIVPAGFEPHDTEDVIQLRNETGFVLDHSPEDWTIADAFHDFSTHLDTLLHSEHFLRDVARRRFRDYDYMPPELRDRIFHDADFRREVLLEVTRGSGSHIHIRKMSPELVAKLAALGLALPGEREWEGWIKIDSGIGYSYMTYLARSISSANGMAVVTDLSSAYCDSVAFAGGPSRSNADQFEQGFGHILIGHFTPKRINDVPLSRLLEIREKYTAERQKFFLTIHELAEKLKSVSNRAEFDAALAAYSKQVTEDAEQLGKIYRGNHIDVVTKMIAVSVPTALTSMAKGLPDQYKPLPIAAGVILGAVTAIRSIQRDRSEMKKQPLSYLLHLQAELEDANAFRRAMHRIGGLMK